ncbi:lipoxygenase homology domain-containing protein 1-like [Pomacea canaliculata]|uniref:lipoxygenase homology domain-containing protein 1-like n=1 Tax=Pomacea canaliculata TaxID=400727 RepID=UPI000D737719|nr:lipoxygenase homology domain-containing protein 1-like [Pomacea canaliculata]
MVYSFVLRTFEEMKRLASRDTGRMWRLVSVLWFLGGFGVNGKEVVWKIQVYTSNVKDAGTDANVRIILYGNEGTSEPLVLDNSENNFEQGKLDTFEVSTADIGELCQVQIYHDNSGNKPGWHLDKVVIWSKDNSKKHYYFLCNCWLARDEGDGRLDRTISATTRCKEGLKAKRRGITEQRNHVTSNGKEFQSSKRSASALNRNRLE